MGQQRKNGRSRKFKKVGGGIQQCVLCAEGVKYIRYKDVFQLKKFTSVRGRIVSREKSGLCAKHQRQLSRAIKRARYMALIPYMNVEA